jgi:hypothetical protein
MRAYHTLFMNGARRGYRVIKGKLDDFDKLPNDSIVFSKREIRVLNEYSSIRLCFISPRFILENTGLVVRFINQAFDHGKTSIFFKGALLVGCNLGCYGPVDKVAAAAQNSTPGVAFLKDCKKWEDVGS